MSTLKFSNTFTVGESVYPASIVQDNDGDFIVVGKTFESNDMKAFAKKISGINDWEKVFFNQYGGLFESIDKLLNGNLIMVGTQFYGITSSEEYLWIVRMDNDGNVLWEYTINDDSIDTQGYSVSATSDGGFIVTGGIIDYINNKTIVIKYDSSNNMEWQKTFDVGLADSIIQPSDGGFALSGCTNPDESIKSYVFALKLDAQGNKVWETIYKDLKNYGPVKSSIIETGLGEFAIVANGIIIIVNSDGNIVYANHFNSKEFTSIMEKDKKKFVVVGSLMSS